MMTSAIHYYQCASRDYRPYSEFMNRPHSLSFSSFSSHSERNSWDWSISWHIRINEYGVDDITLAEWEEQIESLRNQ